MLIIFDLDGTLVRGVKVDVPNRLHEQEFIPGVLEKCAQLRHDGHTLALASNQAGVALRLSTLEEATERVSYAADRIGARRWITSMYHAKAKLQVPHTPDAGISNHAFWRKPQPGMLLYLALELTFPVTDILFVGDMDVDRDAAANAGMRFKWAHKYFRT